MGNFKIGEKVVCVNPIFNLVKGEIYEIKNIITCYCGKISFDLNVEKIAPNYINMGYSTCTNCRNPIPSFNCFGSNRFRKLDYAHTEKICSEIIESLKIKEVQLN